MAQVPAGRYAVRVFTAAAVAAGLVSGAPAAQSRHSGERSSYDGYVLSTEGRWMSSNLDVGEASETRREVSGNFLWFRRSGKTWIVRDPATLDRAVKLFEPLQALEPEQDALSERERKLDRRENALDSEEDRIEAAMERLEPADEADADDGDDDMDTPDARPAAPAPSAEDEREREELARRLDEMHAKQREIQSEQRALENDERALDDREEGIEREAEARLWRLIDEAVSTGIAKAAGEK